MFVDKFLTPLAEHLLLSAIPLIVAIVLAWPTSTWLARAINALKHRGRSSLVLECFVPWRAAVVTLTVMFLPFVPAVLIFENQFMMFVTGITLASFVVALTLLTRIRSMTYGQVDDTSRLLPTIRTLSVLVVGLAVPGYRFYPYGAGVMITAGLHEFMLDTMWNGILVLAAAALVVDLLLGALIYARAATEQSVAAP